MSEHTTSASEQLRELCERAEPGQATVLVDALPAIAAVVAAAEELRNQLDDAIAGADLEAWDAPYRIPTPQFDGGLDAIRRALADLNRVLGDKP